MIGWLIPFLFWIQFQVMNMPSMDFKSVLLGLIKKGRIINAEKLAKHFNIPLEITKTTLLATTQLATSISDEPSLTRKYRTNDRMFRYLRLNCDTFMDNFFTSKGATLLRGLQSCQVFTTDFGNVLVVPMKNKSGTNIALAIKRYFKEKVVPNQLICNQAQEQVKADAQILSHDSGCTVVELENSIPAENCAERNIKILKDWSEKDMFETSSYIVLWYYSVERRADIFNATCRSNHLLQNNTPHTVLARQPTDISNLYEYGWYDWVVYRVEGQ